MPVDKKIYHVASVPTRWELFRRMKAYREKTGISYTHLYNIGVSEYLDRVAKAENDQQKTA